MPEVSVVVPSYNGAARLPRLLSSLAAQRDVQWEAIVVLDGSTDDSRIIVEEAARTLPVRAIDLGENQGRPAALNAGFAAATGRVLVRCDDDLELPPTFLRNHAAHHVGAPVGVIGMCPDVFEDTPYARAYGRQADENIRRSAYAAPESERWRRWSANVSVTRETFDRVGPYDPDYRVYGWEDVDWGYRLHSLGIPVVIPDDIEALHHNPATSTKERAAKALASGASRRLFMSKHPSSPLADVPLDRSAWNLIVRTLAKAPSVVATAAAGVDTLIRVLPIPLSRKLVALVVEAAGPRGRRSPAGPHEALRT